MATIKLPTPLRQFADGQTQVNVEGETIAQVLNHLVKQYPELEAHLFKAGELQSFVNVYLGADNVNDLGGMDTSIDTDANLRIIPSIAGGR